MKNTNQHKANKTAPNKHNAVGSAYHLTNKRINGRGLKVKFGQLISSCESRQMRKRLDVLFFFLHCPASTRHCRSTTGILMRKKANYGRNSLVASRQPNKTPPNNTSTKHRHHRQGNSQNKVKQGETLRAPLSPSLVLFHHVVILHAVHCLDVSHIYICTYILRRVSNVRFQSTSLELISALSSLPPFCTMLHKGINF